MNQQPGGDAAKRAPRQHATLNVPLKMPEIYDIRALRAGVARNPSGVIRPG